MARPVSLYLSPAWRPLFTHFNVTRVKIYVHAALNSTAAMLVQCVDGVNLGGDGSSVVNAASSCQSAHLHFGVNNTRVYTGNPQPELVYCVNGVSLGGDGASRSNVAASCSSAYNVFAVVSAKIYVHASLDAANDVVVQCVNGTSFGGDGSSISASSVSCTALETYWQIIHETRFVNGVLRFVVAIV